jgi:hypothetical protein
MVDDYHNLYSNLYLRCIYWTTQSSPFSQVLLPYINLLFYQKRWCGQLTFQIPQFFITTSKPGFKSHFSQLFPTLALLLCQFNLPFEAFFNIFNNLTPKRNIETVFEIGLNQFCSNRFF